MKRFGRARLGVAQYPDPLMLDAALDDAFGPLRARTANIGAARIRAAVRWSQPEPRPLRGLALVARIGELSVAAVVSAFLFGATLASISPGLPDASRDAANAGEWMLNGRLALQRPIESRATDYRTTAGDLAANAVTVRREATQTDRTTVGQGQTATNR